MSFLYENVELYKIPRFFLAKTYNCSKIHGSDANLPLDGPRDHIFIDLGCISCFFVNLPVDFSYTFHLHFHMCFLLFSFLPVRLQGNIRKARPQRKQYSQIVVGAAMTRRRRLQLVTSVNDSEIHHFVLQQAHRETSGRASTMKITLDTFSRAHLLEQLNCI